ncbi:MAG: Uma2 family endonuclease [Chloroflexi bacterium]|nr:Uma2 family endonuclease [Chloroflexota bacterium]
MVVPITKHRFTVVEYRRMGEAGIFGEDDRVELIEGEIVDMTPIGKRHLAAVDRLNDRSVRGLGDRVIVRVQGALRLREDSEPQPDLVLLRRRPDFYATVDAGPADALLVVEVAETTVQYDREVKVRLYAQAGIPEVWLVDLVARVITVYREPGPQGYRTLFTIRGTDRLSPQAFPEFVLTADQILG